MTPSSPSSPEPLTTPDIDCHDLDGFMLNTERLLASELVATCRPEEIAASLFLWCAAWKQIPAGSLPQNERALASFSRAGRRWNKVREGALHGFVLCSDGRLYHPVLCAEAKRAFTRKQQFAAKREKDAERLRRWREGQQQPLEPVSDELGEATEDPPPETRFVAEGQGQGQGQGQGHSSSLRSEEIIPELRSGPRGGPQEPPAAGDFLQNRGEDLLGKAKAGLIVDMLKLHGDEAVRTALDALERREATVKNRAAFFRRCLEPERKAPQPEPPDTSPPYSDEDKAADIAEVLRRIRGEDAT